MKRVLNKAGDQDAEIIRMVLDDEQAHPPGAAADGIYEIGWQLSPVSILDHRDGNCRCA